MVDTKELMAACFEAETKEEMWICRNLANSIAEKSPCAWKLYYSGEAKTNLSQKSLMALETVIERVENSDESFTSSEKVRFEGKKDRRSRSSSQQKQTRVQRVRSSSNEVRGLMLPRETKIEGLVGSCRRRSVRICQKKVTFEDENLEKKTNSRVGNQNSQAEEKRLIVCALPAEIENVEKKQGEKKKGKMIVDEEVAISEHHLDLQSVKEEDVLILNDVKKEEDDEETYEVFVEGDDDSMKQFHVSTMNETTYLSYLPNMPICPTVAPDDVSPTSHRGTH